MRPGSGQSEQKIQSKKYSKKETIFIRILCFSACGFFVDFCRNPGKLRIGGRSVPNGGNLGTLFRTCRSKAGKLKTMASCTPSSSF